MNAMEMGFKLHGEMSVLFTEAFYVMKMNIFDPK